MEPIIETQEIIDELQIYISIFQLHKSYLILISNFEDMGIGAVSLGSPSTIEDVKSTSSTYTLFGIDKNLLSKVITERAAYILKKPVLVLLYLKTKVKEEEIAKPLVKALNKIFSKIIEKQKEE